MSQTHQTLEPVVPRADSGTGTERLKLALLLAILLALLGLCLLWHRGNQLADEAIYQRMSDDWQRHLQVFVDRPNLKPYFFDKKELTVSDPNRDLVLAVADQRLNAIEAALGIVTPRWSSERRLNPRNTYTLAFTTGPLLCSRIADRWQEFEFARSAAEGACSLTFGP